MFLINVSKHIRFSYRFRVITGTAGMSLGASGALFTILGIYGTLMPESRWSIIFLPMYSFSAEDGIKGKVYDF